MGRPQGRDRPYPRRAGDGHPGQDGAAQGRRACARRGRATADLHPTGDEKRRAEPPDRSASIETGPETMRTARSLILGSAFELACVAVGSAYVQAQETAGNVVNQV